MEINILIIDDSTDDVFFFKKTLSNTGIPATMMSEDNGKSGLERLKKERVDCIFLDYNLPGMDGLEVLKHIRASHDTPVIMLTGQRDEQMIVKLMQEGATDYLSKHALSAESLRISIENSRRIYEIKKEKDEAERALRISEARLAEAQHIGHIGNWEHDPSMPVFFLSNEAQSIIEDHSLNPFSRFMKRIHPDDFPLIRDMMRDLKNGYNIDVNVRFISSNQAVKYLNIKAYLVRDSSRKRTVQKVVGTVQDITILKKALQATQSATIKKKATSIVLVIAVLVFLLSEALLDPFIDSFSTGILISLSFKGGVAVALKPVEFILEKIMMSKAAIVA